MVQGKKNIIKSEKALSQADFSENPVISFSVLRAIKSTGFRKKSGAFLTFYGIMKDSKIPMGLAVELVLALLKVHKGENPTF